MRLADKYNSLSSDNPILTYGYIPVYIGKPPGEESDVWHCLNLDHASPGTTCSTPEENVYDHVSADAPALLFPEDTGFKIGGGAGRFLVLQAHYRIQVGPWVLTNTPVYKGFFRRDVYNAQVSEPDFSGLLLEVVSDRVPEFRAGMGAVRLLYPAAILPTSIGEKVVYNRPEIQ